MISIIQKILVGLSAIVSGGVTNAVASDGHRTIAANGVILCVGEDGLVYASGDALPHRGDDDGSKRSHFLPINGLSNIVSVHSTKQSTDAAAALDRDGGVWQWGDRWFRVVHADPLNESEDVDPDLRHVPARLPGVSDAKSIALGGNHLVVLHRDGTVSTVASGYGSNDYGQMGTGDTEATTEPFRVPNVSDAVSIAAGDDSTLILRQDGTVWGMGSRSMLGKPLSESEFLSGSLDLSGAGDAQVTANRIVGLSDITQIDLGVRFGVALDRSGQVWGWGSNDSGQLWMPESDLELYSPRPLPGLDAVTTISAGEDFLLCVLRDGTVVAQGGNVHAALGDRKNELAGKRRRIGGLRHVTAVFGGAFNAFARVEDGSLWGWGNQAGGGFSSGSPSLVLPPVKLNPIIGP